MALNKQAIKAQAECLRAKGYEADARNVERGWIEFDPDALEMLEPRDAQPPPDAELEARQAQAEAEAGL